MSVFSIPRRPGSCPPCGAKATRHEPWKHLACQLFLAACLLFAHQAPARMLDVGDTALPFVLEDVAGVRVSLQERLQSKAVLIMFSSVGCAPCEDSSEALREAAARFGNQLEVICVMLSDANVVRRRTYPLAEPGGPRLLIDAKATESGYPTAAAYGVLGTPTSFLIDRDGTIVWRHVGQIRLSHVFGGLQDALGG